MKSLTDTQKAILDAIRKSKRKEEKGYLQVKPSSILTPAQLEYQSYHKNTIYEGNLDSNVSIENNYDSFGLKSTVYCRINSHVGFLLNQQTQKTKSQVNITAPKHVWGDLVKRNSLEFGGKFLFIEIAKVKPKETNPNKINFTSSNRSEPLRFTNNSPNLRNGIEHIEESDSRVDFNRTVRNSQANSKHISKMRPHVIIDAHPENQMTFSKVTIFPGHKSYSDAITKINKVGKYSYQVELKGIISSKL